MPELPSRLDRILFESICKDSAISFAVPEGVSIFDLWCCSSMRISEKSSEVEIFLPYSLDNSKPKMYWVHRKQEGLN